jgi:TolB-like protein
VQTVTKPEALVFNVIPVPRCRVLQLRSFSFVFSATLIGAIGYVSYVHFRSPRPAIHSLAVLPLKNLSGDPSQEYFADGMTEEMIGRLSMIRGLRVVSRTSVMQFKDTRTPVPQIAKALGVDALVEGSVNHDGSRVRVHAQLIRGATDEHFWSETYDRELGDALALESDTSATCFSSYLKGQGQFASGTSRADIEKSLAFFEDAIRQDPTFAPAYLVGLR